MIPGPVKIYKCPKCNNLLNNRSLRSGNTIGAKLYSDGNRVVPMLPEYPNLTKCKKCNHIFWLSKTELYCNYKWGEEFKSDWLNSQGVGFLTIDEYFSALELNVAENMEEEIFIRERIWWAFNDNIRSGIDVILSDNDKLLKQKNTDALLNILDEGDLNQKIMIAEISRNSGDFEKCIRLIESIVENDMDWLKDAFIKECEKKNQKLFLIY